MPGGLCESCGSQMRARWCSSPNGVQEFEMVQQGEDLNEEAYRAPGHDSSGLRCRHCRHCPQKKAQICLGIMGFIGGLLALGAIGFGIRGMLRHDERIIRPCPTGAANQTLHLLNNHTGNCSRTSTTTTRSKVRISTRARQEANLNTIQQAALTQTQASVAGVSTTAQKRQSLSNSYTTSTNQTSAAVKKTTSSLTPSTTSSTSVSSTAVTSNTSSSAPPTSIPHRFVNESSYAADMAEHVDPIWECRTESSITVTSGVGSGCATLKTVSLLNSHAKGDVLIVQGRGECMTKYKEVIADFYQQGYSVYSYDHQGQGGSSRGLADEHRGYVDHFGDYASNLAQVIRGMKLGNGSSPLHIVAQSMGGAATCGLLENNLDLNITSVTLTAPMMGIPMGMLTRFGVLFSDTWVGRGVFNLFYYAPGRFAKINMTTPFEGNGNTGSKARHNAWQETQKNCPQVEPTMKWVQQAVKGAKNCVDNANEVPGDVPIFLARGSNDTKVDANSQDKFWENAKGKHLKSKMTTYAGGNHELLMETDPIRKEVMSDIFSFMAQVETDAAAVERMEQQEATKSQTSNRSKRSGGKGKRRRK